MRFHEFAQLKSRLALPKGVVGQNNGRGVAGLGIDEGFVIGKHPTQLHGLEQARKQLPGRRWPHGSSRSWRLGGQQKRQPAASEKEKQFFHGMKGEKQQQESRKI
ncbi:hypothetical protein [Hymenobacter amundsenii]|uniref:hypothetical protein n=1 Tax=Hymenobacter amundsenii TaxID=2006685 RepID=UPI001F5B3F4F|nr:hypothetical protein [Hymenobacter amundsenii]